MNQQRRDRLSKAVEIISAVREEEQEARDNMPETFETKIEQMEVGIDALEEAEQTLNVIIEGE